MREKHFRMKQKHFFIIFLSFLINSNFLFSQSTLNVLWDKDEDKPIAYATIKGIKNYSVSNEKGVFELEKMDGKITIQSVVYETLEIDYNFLKTKDTIYMQPLTYELDEVLISKESLYTQMLKTVLTDYTLEPHKEEFFLRAVIRKDSEIYKIIDFSGLVEKQTLFETKTKPMPKRNYKIQIDNIRKVGLDDRDIDILMFSFKDFFTYLIRLSFNKDDFDITYESTTNNDSKRITLEPKDKEKTKFKGYFLLNRDNTFREADITYLNNNSNYQSKRDIKYRTKQMNWKSNFERNTNTGKLQLHKGKIIAELELIRNDTTEIYEFTYIYNSKPLDKNIAIKNNINLKKDMFKLKSDYNQKYWENHEILTLTNEMQEFINRVNTMGKNSDFKTKTNMN